MIPGTLGHIFTSLSFASAFIAMFSLFWAEKEEGLEKRNWERMGMASFGLHIISVLGIIGTLFGLIYTHRYEYHYVWSHSSNELPVYYMISCFWEGQEGSFLLWSFWHSILGGLILWKGPKKWKGLVLGVIASVELILSSMLLGIYVGQSWAYGLYLALLLAPAAYFALRYLRSRDELPWQGSFHIAGVFLAALSLLLILRGQDGFGDPWSLKGMLSSFDSFAFGLFVLALWAYGLFYLFYARTKREGRGPRLGEMLAGAGLLIAAVPIAFFDIESWKVGSTPFILLKDVFPDNPVYAANPDFIPTNGTGLNSLLQNYWMVIHPPTLFLGFASTVVPFSFVVAGLIRGQYRDWVKPAMPWNLFSVMILGVGIIMGGYWAYETLNFGGYWNWDPVENGSLVPWLCGIGSLHAMLIYQKTKSSLKLSMILIALTFWLVLYSTFLTRSGILGDTSVHTFTDLGLSGQLVLLMGIYLAALVVLLAHRWKAIPERKDDGKAWTAEFLLLLGVLIFSFAGLVIILSTSLPVFNEIFGSNLAPPAEVQYFYYKWTIWFAIGIGVFSATGQFLWWRMGKKKKVSEALFRPFLIAMVVGCLVLIGLHYLRMSFAYDSDFAKLVDPEFGGGGLLEYLEYGILSFADELLLFSSLFVIAASLDVLFSLIRKSRKGLKVIGGSLAHTGFGLMLLGILFSSGYDSVMSVNVTPGELMGFSDDEKIDNVRLDKNRPRLIKDYQVTYIGKKEAVGPVRSLEVIEETAEWFKVRFRDVTGDQFGFVLPRPVFLIKEDGEEGTVHPTSDVIATGSSLEGELDMEYVEEFLNKNLEYIKPGHINNRHLYGLKFEPIQDGVPDSTAAFVLYPEAEINEEMKSIIAHPARNISWNRDLYVHVSQLPANENEEPKYKYHDLQLKMGDTLSIDKIRLFFPNVVNLSDKPKMKGRFEIALAANILAIAGRDTFLTNPTYLVDKENKFSMTEASIEELHLDFAFYRIDPEKELFFFQVRQLLNPTADFVVFKALGKPFINLLWLGTFILTFGFLMAIYRRITE